jgi:hypothetical protein
MTNRELLRTPRDVLSQVDRQRQYLLRVELTPSPCPACREPVNALDAAGIDLDAYQFGKEKTSCCCPACGAELEQVVPVFAFAGPGWHWELQYGWLVERLRRARIYDQQHPEAL